MEFEGVGTQNHNNNLTDECTSRNRWLGGEGECSRGAVDWDHHENKPITLIVIILSARHHFDRRNVIRKTWASDYDKTRIKLFFVVGTPTSKDKKDHERMLQIESRTNGYDIIHVPVADTYNNLIYKLVLAFDHVEQFYSRRYNFLLKVDDDTFVNLPLLIKDLVNPLKSTRRTIIGEMWLTTPIRDENHKNFIDELYYPMEKLMPHPHGAHYIITSDFVEYIVSNENMLSKSIIPTDYRGSLEDVRIGTWAFGVGLNFVHDYRFVEAINCHSQAISITSVPLNLFEQISHGRDDNGSIIMCIDQLREHAALEYLGSGKHHLKNGNAIEAANSYKHSGANFAIIGELSLALKQFKVASDIYDKLGVNDEVKPFLEYLKNINKTMGKCTPKRKCFQNIKQSIDMSFQKFAQRTDSNFFQDFAGNNFRQSISKRE
eukprot:g5687.t1